jgi:hypothetical protein
VVSLLAAEQGNVALFRDIKANMEVYTYMHIYKVMCVYVHIYMCLYKQGNIALFCDIKTNMEV